MAGIVEFVKMPKLELCKDGIAEEAPVLKTGEELDAAVWNGLEVMPLELKPAAETAELLTAILVLYPSPGE